MVAKGLFRFGWVQQDERGKIVGQFSYFVTNISCLWHWIALLYTMPTAFFGNDWLFAINMPCLRHSLVLIGFLLLIFHAYGIKIGSF